MEHVRWINDHELQDSEGKPLEGVLDALYNISGRLNFVIKSETPDDTKEWIAEHDEGYREVAKDIVDDLQGDFSWEASRRRAFYYRVAHYGLDLVHRVFVSDWKQNEWEKLDLDALLSVIPLYLKSEDKS